MYRKRIVSDFDNFWMEYGRNDSKDAKNNTIKHLDTRTFLIYRRISPVAWSLVKTSWLHVGYLDGFLICIDILLTKSILLLDFVFFVNVTIITEYVIAWMIAQTSIKIGVEKLKKQFAQELAYFLANIDDIRPNVNDRIKNVKKLNLTNFANFTKLIGKRIRQKRSIDKRHNRQAERIIENSENAKKNKKNGENVAPFDLFVTLSIFNVIFSIWNINTKKIITKQLLEQNTE